METFDISLGLGVTRPASVRTRRIVEVEGGAGCPSSASRSRMLAGPWSSPAAPSSARSSMMRRRTACGVVRELVWGRLERGSTASIPPCS